jgi:hypothetical protein
VTAGRSNFGHNSRVLGLGVVDGTRLSGRAAARPD